MGQFCVQGYILYWEDSSSDTFLHLWMELQRNWNNRDETTLLVKLTNDIIWFNRPNIEMTEIQWLIMQVFTYVAFLLYTTIKIIDINLVFVCRYLFIPLFQLSYPLWLVFQHHLNLFIFHVICSIIHNTTYYR